MKPSTIVAISIMEFLGLALILRLWLPRKRRKKLLPRIIWQLILLVPGFGLMMYGLIHIDPEAHPNYIEEFGSDPPDDGGGDGHGH